MRYIYAADVWCEPCAHGIMGRLTREGRAPESRDERDYDSDDYPKGPYPAEECDAPEHCVAGAECLAAEEWDGRRVGHFFRNPLTGEGISAMGETIARLKVRGDAPDMLDAYRREYPEADGASEECEDCGGFRSPEGRCRTDCQGAP